MSVSKCYLLASPHDRSLFSFWDSSIQSLRLVQVNFEAAFKNDTTKETSFLDVTSHVKSVGEYSLKTTSSFCKCMDWYAGASLPRLFAIGCSDGTVTLARLGEKSTSETSKISLPSDNRSHPSCNALAWCSTKPIIVASYEQGKAKNSDAVSVWNVSDDLTSPTSTYQCNDRVTCLSWLLGNSAETIAFGCGTKLRFWDTREQPKPSSPFSTHHTSPLSSIVTTPFQTNTIATVTEHDVSTWDIRNMASPLCTCSFHENNSITKAAWSVTRRRLLGVLCSDSLSFRTYDIFDFGSSFEESEMLICGRSSAVLPQNQNPVPKCFNSFCWCYSENGSNSVLTVSVASAVGKKSAKIQHFPNVNTTFRVTPIRDRISFGASSMIEMSAVVSSGSASGPSGYQHKLHLLPTDTVEPACLPSTAYSMKRRAADGLYGIDLSKTMDLVHEDPSLTRLWSWIQSVKNGPLSESTVKATGIPGVLEVIRENMRPDQDADQAQNSDKETRKCCVIQLHGQADRGSDPDPAAIHCYQYLSDVRNLALHLCGWGYDTDGKSVDDYCERLEAHENFERSAAIALFDCRGARAALALDKAIKYYSGLDKEESGYSAEYIGQRVNMFTLALLVLRLCCGASAVAMQGDLASGGHHLGDAYLRAIFFFVEASATNRDYSRVLQDNQIALADRLVIALKYLNGEHLIDYLFTLKRKLLVSEDAILDGILLTGVTKAGMDLLENYVNKTADIQTALLVVLQGYNAALANDSRFNNWLDTYRDLLDKWLMWTERARFDSYVTQVRGTSSTVTVADTVKLMCNFCNKSIISGQVISRARTTFHNTLPSLPPAKPKANSCPSCRKPLPRCALCLVHMGTPSSVSTQSHPSSTHGQKKNDFSNWFSWCQSCRHGGHADHISSWFQQHQRCPVTGCPCNCISRDSVAAEFIKRSSSVSSSATIDRHSNSACARDT